MDEKSSQGNGLWLNWYCKESSGYHLGVDTKEDYFKILNLLADRFSSSDLFGSPDILDSLIPLMIDSSMYPKVRRHAL